MTENDEMSMSSSPESRISREMQLRLASRVERHAFEPGATIVKQGQEANRFFIVTRGAVDIVRERPNRPEQPIATLGEGDYFGEIGLLEGVPRTATVRASKDGGAEVLIMDRSTFADFVSSSEQTEEEIAAVVRERVLSLQLAKALPMLTPPQLKKVYPQLEMLSYEPGETIIKQGEPADRFYILVSGRCEVIDHQPGGRDVIVDIREPGEYFGEIGLLQNKPRTATVRAAADSPVEVMALEREEFLAMTADSRATEVVIAREMIQRMIGLAQAQ